MKFRRQFNGRFTTKMGMLRGQYRWIVWDLKLNKQVGGCMYKTRSDAKAQATRYERKGKYFGAET